MIFLYVCEGIRTEETEETKIEVKLYSIERLLAEGMLVLMTWSAFGGAVGGDGGDGAVGGDGGIGGIDVPLAFTFALQYCLTFGPIDDGKTNPNRFNSASRDVKLQSVLSNKFR